MSKIYWTMTTETYNLYKHYSDEMLAAAREGDQLRYQEAEDNFKALPGRPLHQHPELDLVVPKIVDTGIKIYSH